MKESTGDNTDFSLNFVPKMKQETLIDGYKEILNTIYSPKHYYARIKTLLKEYKPKTKSLSLQSKRWNIQGFFNCMWFMGIRENGTKILLETGGFYFVHPTQVISSFNDAFHLRLSFPQSDQTIYQ